MTDLATSFNSYWGNALLGIYVEWKISEYAATPDAETTLSAKFTLNMYAVGDQLDASTLTDGETMNFYMLIQNPLTVFDFNASAVDGEVNPTVHNTWVPFDGMKAEFQTDVGADGATYELAKTLLITDWDLTANGAGAQATANTLQDIYCTEAITDGIYDTTNCELDTVDIAPKTGNANSMLGRNDWTNAESPDLKANYCVELWTVNTYVDATTQAYHQRCVRLEVEGNRKFQTLDNTQNATDEGLIAAAETNTFDIDLTYRKYSITTGWELPSSTATAPPTDAPGKIEFDAVEVDFANFTRAAAVYESGVQGYAIAGAGMLAAICAMSF